MSVSISWFVIGIIYNLFHCRLFSYLNEEKFKITLKMLILSFLFSLANLYTIANGILIRPLIINICYVIIVSAVYKNQFSKNLVSILLISILLNLSELIFVNVFLKTGLINQQYSISNAFGVLLTNIIILTICIILFCIPKVKKFLSWLIKWYSSKRIINDIAMMVIIVVSVAIISYQNFGYDITKSYIITTNAFLISVIILIIAYFRQKASNTKLEVEYDHLSQYIKICEEFLNEKSKQQHEYKNQLSILKNMIQENNSAVEYINGILGIEDNEEEEWLLKIKNIPQGGLKGLFYYKIALMKEKGINFYIEISNEMKDETVWGTCIKNLKDVSRVLGVYIDNAIEAAVSTDKKYVIIEAELINKDIVFTFSNTYRGTVDIDRIDIEGFSTKGKGKGYGLALVKDIINKNACLEQQREINGIYYVQKLIIKGNQ